MQRRSPEEVAAAIVAAPLALGLVFGTALVAGVTILVLSLTYGAEAHAAACPTPDVEKRARRAEVAPGATLAPSRAAPLVSATDAWDVACAEPGAAGASRAMASYGLLSGPRFGIPPPGKPVWVVTFEDACVPAGEECTVADLGVVVDALSGDRLASYPAG